VSDLVHVPRVSLATAAERLDGFDSTPQGLALDFADFVGGRLLFLSEEQRWIAFNGRCWDTANGQTLAEMSWDEYIGYRISLVTGFKGDALKAALEQLKGLSTLRMRNEVLQLARTKLAQSRDAFDRDSNHLLVTPSGTVDLRSGVLGPNDPKQLLTQCTTVPYEPEAEPPQRFGELVNKLAGDDPETVMWLWRAIGYTLTGDVREDAVFYLRGPGGNGKSTLVKTLFGILGAYAAKLDIRVLASGSEFHATEIANLRGARFVVSSEIDKGMRLRESVLKDLSGGEVQTPRDIQQKAKDAARWVPSCKLWLYGNHDLAVTGTDDGIWRRLNKIESSHKFPKSGLRDALAEQEGIAILAMAVSAAGYWYAHGLGQPARVKAHTDAYRREQDVLGQFFSERVVFEPGAFVSGVELRAMYEVWRTERDYDFKVGPKEFEARLRDRGCALTRVRNVRGWAGAKLCQHLADVIQ
jgi:putative DNA primase/helicase